MGAYIARRLLLMIPTLFGIMAISFVVIQFAPGGPVEQVIAQHHRHQGRLGPAVRRRRGCRGAERRELRRRILLQISRRPGARSRIHRRAREAVRLRQTAARALRQDAVGLHARFDFGESFFRDIRVIDLILEKMPVSISLGLWITLISYIDLHPARDQEGGEGRLDLRHLDQRRGHRRLRDSGFLFAILLMMLFAGGNPSRFSGDQFYGFRWARLPAPWPHLRQLGPALALGARSSTISGI
jgi:microcin C transport system permease protein